jgi:putative Mg2+ transporter-C (MgtC) family protein
MDIAAITPFIKILLATFLGLMIGAERTLAGKNAGMRTFSLVSLGAALMVVMAQEIMTQFPVDQFQISHIISGVITGVGFIGAGMIFSKDDLLKGLTSAAGLWASAAIGMTAGFGLYILSIFSTLLVLFVFTALWFVEEKIRLTIETKRDIDL